MHKVMFKTIMKQALKATVVPAELHMRVSIKTPFKFS